MQPSTFGTQETCRTYWVQHWKATVISQSNHAQTWLAPRARGRRASSCSSCFSRLVWGKHFGEAFLVAARRSCGFVRGARLAGSGATSKLFANKALLGIPGKDHGGLDKRQTEKRNRRGKAGRLNPRESWCVRQSRPTFVVDNDAQNNNRSLLEPIYSGATLRPCRGWRLATIGLVWLRHASACIGKPVAAATAASRVADSRGIPEWSRFLRQHVRD